MWREWIGPVLAGVALAAWLYLYFFATFALGVALGF